MPDVQYIIANSRHHPGSQAIQQLKTQASINVADQTFPTAALARFQLKDVADRFYPTLLTRCDPAT